MSMLAMPNFEAIKQVPAWHRSIMQIWPEKGCDPRLIWVAMCQLEMLRCVLTNDLDLGNIDLWTAKSMYEDFDLLEAALKGHLRRAASRRNVSEAKK